MAIQNELNNSTEDRILTSLAFDTLTMPSTFVRLLVSKAKIITGPAGQGLGLTDETEQADGTHYRRFDPVIARTAQEGSVRRFARWTNFQSHVGLSGTDMEENLGISSRRILKDEMSFKELGPRATHTIFSMAQRSFTQACARSQNQLDVDAWGLAVPGQRNQVRAPESLPQLFDPNAPWHGLAKDGLGRWPEGLHPWGDNPPSDLPGDDKYLRNLPQVFDNGGNALSKEVLDEANQAMIHIPGIWACPLRQNQFAKIQQLYDRQEYQNVRINYNIWRIGIDTIRLYNTFYFLDNRAPENEAYHVHLGMENDENMMMSREEFYTDAGFCLVFWVEEEQFDELAEMHEGLMPPGYMPDPAAGNEINLGMNRAVPYYHLGWDRDQNMADAFYDSLLMKYSFCGPHRWKNFTIKNLAV